MSFNVYEILFSLFQITDQQEQGQQIQEENQQKEQVTQQESDPTKMTFQERMEYYQKLRKQKLDEIRLEMNKEITLKPKIQPLQQISKSGDQDKQDTAKQSGERQYQAYMEKHKEQIELLKQQKGKPQNQEFQAPAAPQHTMTDKEREEFEKQGFTFKPEITEMAKEHQYENGVIATLYELQKIAKSKVEKARVQKRAKEDAKCTFQPNSEAKENNAKWLKDSSLEKLPVESRLFARKIQSMQKFSEEQPIEEEYTFQPEINQESKKIMQSKLQSSGKQQDVTTTLYELGKTKLRQQLEQSQENMKAQSQEQEDLLQELYSKPISKKAQPGREVEIMKRAEESQRKWEKKVNQLREQEQEQRQIKLSARNEQLANKRKQEIENGTFVSLRKPIVEQYSFQPKINQKSQQMMNTKSFSQNISASERLYQYATVQRQKLEQEKKRYQEQLKEQAKQELKSSKSDYQPQISTTFEQRQKQYLLRKQELELERKKREQEQVDASTFKPQIVKLDKKILYQNNLNNQALDKSALKSQASFMQRTQAAREERQRQKDVFNYKPKTNRKPTKFQEFAISSYHSVNASQVQQDKIITPEYGDYTKMLNQCLQQGKHDQEIDNEMMQSNAQLSYIETNNDQQQDDINSVISNLKSQQLVSSGQF